MKKILTIVVIALAVLASLCILKNQIAKGAVEGGVKLVTGLDLKMGSLNVGLLTSSITIKDLNLQNPEGFPEGNMVEMPLIHVKYNLKDILGGLIHLENIQLQLKEFSLVKSETGELNIDRLKAIAEQAGGDKAPDEAKEKKDSKPMQIQIDVLGLRVDKASFKDYSKGGEPKVTEFNVGINEQLENITDPYKLVLLIVTRVLTQSTLGNLANVNLGALQAGLSGVGGVVADSAAAVSKQQVDKFAESATVASDTAKETVKETTEALTSGLNDLKEKVSLPFGKDE